MVQYCPRCRHLLGVLERVTPGAGSTPALPVGDTVRAKERAAPRCLASISCLWEPRVLLLLKPSFCFGGGNQSPERWSDLPEATQSKQSPAGGQTQSLKPCMSSGFCTVSQVWGEEGERGERSREAPPALEGSKRSLERSASGGFRV